MGYSLKGHTIARLWKLHRSVSDECLDERIYVSHLEFQDKKGKICVIK